MAAPNSTSTTNQQSATTDAALVLIAKYIGLSVNAAGDFPMTLVGPQGLKAHRVKRDADAK